MNRTLIFIASIVAPTAARAADIGVTYAFSPGLELEGNPLMAAIGFPGIIAVNSAVVIATSLMTYYWWRHPVALKMPEDRDDTWAFASLNYYGTEYSPRSFAYKCLTKFPTNWPMAIQMTGLALAVILVVGSCMAVFSWFAVHQWHLIWYRQAYFRTHFAFPYALLFPVYLYTNLLYFKAEHNRLRSDQDGRCAR